MSGTPPCPHSSRVRDDTHDAYYCTTCSEWLEGPCDDPSCGFCPTRPARQRTPVAIP